MTKLIHLLLLSAVAVCVTSCSKEEQQVKRESGFPEFVENYNQNISEWLLGELVRLDKQEAKLEDELASAGSDLEKTSIEGKIKDLAKKRAKYTYRQSLGKYFDFKKEEDIPDDLVWENGKDNPIIGDPRAKKGGSLHTYMLSFPKTLRPFGPNSNHSLRGELYDLIDMSLIAYHPITEKVIPAVAKEWAYGADGSTVFYRIDPDATYNDGVKVKAVDFMFYLYVRISDNVSNPFQKQYFREQFANMTTYGDSVISISLPEPKPRLPLFTNISPSAPHFYEAYGPDYKDRYQWLVPPTTGAYTVLPKDIKKGRSLTQSRVKDWWAKDKKYYKHANTVDMINFQVIADQSKAFELFLIGDIDFFSLNVPDYWYEKMEVPQYFDGYIEKVQFYNVFPRTPRGLYLNLAKKPLDNLNVRKGLSHAMDFDTVNTVLFRGDVERLQSWTEGYGKFSNPNIRAREYSVSKAEEYFAKAGYTKRDSEGYLMSESGKRMQLEVTWGRAPIYDQMMDKLKEGAKKAGVEILLDGQISSVAFTKMLEKRHDAAFLGWNVQPPFPRYYGSFHSKNAYDEKGNIKQQTTNMNSFRNAEMDRLSENIRAATSEEALQRDSWKAEQLIHDEALFIPAIKSGYLRQGHWRWLKWPQTQYYEFNAPSVSLAYESYLYWIDEDLKKETLAAKKAGKTFPEQNNFYDIYRKGIPTLNELEQRKVKQN